MRPHGRSLSMMLAVFSIILEFNACKEVQNVVGPGGRGSLTDPSVAPVILFSLPGNGAVGPFPVYTQLQSSLPHFVVQFNKLMDVSTMDRYSVRVEGFRRGVYVYPRGTYYFNFSDIVEFSVQDSAGGGTISYELGKTYTVRFLSSVRDINGISLGDSSSFSFTPEPNFRVVGVYPPPENSPLTPTYTTFPTVYFNSPIDKNMFSYFQISPTLSGTWQMRGDSLSAAFNLANGLAFSSTYVFQVLAGAEDQRHHALASEYVATYTTKPFGVDYVYPEKGSADLSTTTYVYFAFTGLLDPTSVEGAVSISPSVPFYTSAWNNYIELYPQNRFATNTHYTVTLATSLKSTNGTHLPAPYMLDFTTQPFMISWISPSDGSTNVHRSTSIYVSCNDVLDGETIPSAFSISPAVSGIFSISESSFSFIPSSTLAPKTAYTVTVASSLKSSSGSPLPGAMVATFTTSE